jgi:hypothetical protein
MMVAGTKGTIMDALSSMPNLWWPQEFTGAASTPPPAPAPAANGAVKDEGATFIKPEVGPKDK